MDKITDYTTVTGDSPAELDESVKVLLDKGWQPFGGPVTQYRPHHNPASSLPGKDVLVQAMVIYKTGGPG